MSQPACHAAGATTAPGAPQSPAGVTNLLDREAPWLTAIVLAHAALLAAAVSRGDRPDPPASPPRVLAALVAPAPAAVQRTSPAAPVEPPTPPLPRQRPVAPRQPPPRSAAVAPVIPAEPSPQPPPLVAPSTAARDVPAVEATPAQASTPPRAASEGSPPPTSAAAQAPPRPPPAAADAVVPPHTHAAHLHNAAPAYPALSRRLREQGRVLLDLLILPDGTVGEIAVQRSSGFGRLDQAALDAVRRWQYVPARRGDRAIAMRYVQPVVFALEE